MFKKHPKLIWLLVSGIVAGGVLTGLLSPAPLSAVYPEARGVDIEQLYATTASNLPRYEDTYQHYGILDPVKP